MVTQTEEEQQVRDYLKRAEVRTMKKDLKKLRESDALKERDKIVNLKTTEELAIPKKQIQDEGIKQVLEHNVVKERQAERDLKKYANEAEKQQIFLLESERVAAQDELKQAETKQEPELVLKKNQLMVLQQKSEAKLNSILEEEKKRESEENYIEEKEKQSTISSEKKSLEERRSELESQRQEIEKRRWAVEKDISEVAKQIKNFDYDFEILTALKQKLNNKIKDIDNSLRTIYSGIITKEEEKRQGEEAGQKMRKEELAKAGAERKERIQREQWSGSAPVKAKPFLSKAPEALKEKLAKSAQTEEEQRRQFLKNIEEKSHE